MSPETARRVAANEIAKGDVIGAARFAGIQAAKDAHTYLLALDPLPLSRVTVDARVDADFIDVLASAEATSTETARLHALTAATVAALTVYDMCKSVDRTMTIGPVAVVD